MACHQKYSLAAATSPPLPQDWQYQASPGTSCSSHRWLECCLFGQASVLFFACTFSTICMRTILFSAATHPVPHSIQLMHQCEGILVHYQWKANKQLTGIVSSSKKHPFNLQSFWTLISGWKSCKSFHPCCNLLVLQVQENLCTQHTQNTKIRRNCDTNFAIIHPHQAFYP